MKLKSSTSNIAYKDYGYVSNCLKNTTEQGKYHFNNNSSSRPGNASMGTIITNALSGNDTVGTLVSVRLAICTDGEVYSSVFISGTSYGSWNKINSSYKTEINDLKKISLTLLGGGSNLIYGCYATGIYTINGSEAGNPLPGYSGFMLTVDNGYVITKVLFLQNTYAYIMSQKSSGGTVVSNWQRFSPN